MGEVTLVQHIIDDSVDLVPDLTLELDSNGRFPIVTVFSGSNCSNEIIGEKGKRDDLDIEGLSPRNVNAESINVFVKLAEDDQIYYTLMAILDEIVVWQIDLYCDVLAMDKIFPRICMLGIFTDIFALSRYRLLKKGYRNKKQIER